MTVPASADPREAVVLLHGVKRTRWCMRTIERLLGSAGYRTINRTYPSRKMPVDRLATAWLPAVLSANEIAGAPRVHFVAHSMGTLLVRHLMAHARPHNAGRFVFLGPPSLGSDLADNGKPRWLFKSLVGVNLHALGKAEDAFWRTLPQEVDYPVGVIAGTGPGNPFGRNLPKPNDGTVTVAETRIEGVADAIQVPFSHAGMLRRHEVAEQVLQFLQHGRFNHIRPRPV